MINTCPKHVKDEWIEDILNLLELFSKSLNELGWVDETNTKHSDYKLSEPDFLSRSHLN